MSTAAANETINTPSPAARNRRGAAPRGYRERSSPRPRGIYLDHAATSWPKPPAVLRAMTDSLERAGGNPGHGSHPLALAAAREVYACRAAAAEMFGTSPERVIFTLNTTHALNLALKGLLKPGDRVICSDMEHNAVFRTLEGLAGRGQGISYGIFDTFPLSPARSEGLILASLTAHLTPDVRLVVVSHESNLVPAVLPLAAIGRLCRERGILFVVDAAQSAGLIPIDMERMHVDALCLPGHKGLLGPMGCGMLLLGERIRPSMLSTLMEGGNGVDSLSPAMSEDLPERYEPGTLPLPAIAGLRAGMAYVSARTPEEICASASQLAAEVKEGLSVLPGISLIAPHHEGPTLLFTHASIPSEELAARLDGSAPAGHDGRCGEGAAPRFSSAPPGGVPICVRAGFHCAAQGHRTLGTPEGGAVRVSFGWNSTRREAAAFLSAMREITRL